MQGTHCFPFKGGRVPHSWCPEPRVLFWGARLCAEPPLVGERGLTHCVYSSPWAKTFSPKAWPSMSPSPSGAWVPLIHPPRGGVIDRTGLRANWGWVCTLPLPLISCVTLGKSLHLSELQESSSLKWASDIYKQSCDRTLFPSELLQVGTLVPPLGC